ncbi:lysozyme inhibitor LprI family protein [Asticcacaulis sp. AC402]|uniref:lysozyme inhibitor LprI family protein n=1 Tax=Asticcacaulis sp. AC402 TaxID=1282361 RepID=UPI0003C40379|nr:lysozyme inhibitor LprI family protein [Asticcacaulis sp. AC402]ESQ76432.1 hypothetical protein ABAC402_04850 [Asticcacaulis sp. AC402]
MRPVKLFIILACIVAPLTATAQRALWDTRDAELAHSNETLNATYQALIRQLSPEDQAALRKAQRAWIAFRDADCEVGWADTRDCLITRTDEREQQLRDSFYWGPGGKPVEFPGRK